MDLILRGDDEGKVDGVGDSSFVQGLIFVNRIIIFPQCSGFDTSSSAHYAITLHIAG